MFDPPLAILRQTIHPDISKATVKLIKHSSTPAAVYRIFMQSKLSRNGAFPHTAVAKLATPHWPNDPSGHLREVGFYAELWPQLDLGQPHIYYAGPEPRTNNHLVIMEDLWATHRFPETGYCWTMKEMPPVLDAYARLHAQSLSIPSEDIDRPWLANRHEVRLRETAADLPAMAQTLVDRGIWPPMPGLSALLEQTLAAAVQYEAEPAALIHSDVVPANIALPRKAGTAAILVDWEMACLGLPEMDLAFMFLQPFSNERYLDRKQVLERYWQARYELENGQAARQKSAAERRARQFYADSLWALWLIPVAYKAAVDPFPADTFPHTYWKTMHQVLARKLVSLLEQITSAAPAVQSNS